MRSRALCACAPPPARRSIPSKNRIYRLCAISDLRKTALATN
jgi:hypothetical protein